MAYSITNSGTTEQGEFFYMVKISETRYQRFCYDEEKTLDDMTTVLDEMLEGERLKEEAKKKEEEEVAANVK
tara:strand:- start:44 stop:259 length:216 start_codon:yes stop_codon:yes gene_type:complete